MSNKKVLIINGHPDAESFNFGLAAAYKKGAINSGADVQEIIIRELDFNPNLEFGYRKRTALEPDLLNAQEQIKWADHIVWIYPVWWGSVPAIMKGFLDRILLPGYAFNKIEGSWKWNKFLGGKTARMICTMDQPAWFYRWINSSPSHSAMKKLCMQFIGIKTIGISSIGNVRLSKSAYRQKWLSKVEKLGLKNK